MSERSKANTTRDYAAAVAGALAFGGSELCERGLKATGNCNDAANDNPALGDQRLFTLRHPGYRATYWQLATKRTIDIMASSMCLVILLPALVAIAVAVRLESKGWPIFRQQRVGLHGGIFNILKFRSMYEDQCDAAGIDQTKQHDARVTRVGRLLRRSNLDELPQLWNVLRGDMSMVGPRPHVPGMIAAGCRYEELVAGYAFRHLMRPGLTGLAQSRGLRGPTVDRWKATRRIVCDVEYIRNFSLLLDVRIVLRTIANEINGGTGS